MSVLQSSYLQAWCIYSVRYGIISEAMETGFVVEISGPGASAA